MPSSSLVIGPLEFLTAVQSISIQENKAVEVIETTRTNRNFLIDSGQSDQRAQIQLIFSGVEEINDSLRKLIALFRCTPFISVQNEFLSTSWKRYNKIQMDERTGYAGLAYIPVALEELSITTAPDLPYTLYVSLTISRIDVSCIHGEDLLYQGEDVYSYSPDPRQAHWLKKWIQTMLDRNIVPSISTADFEFGVGFRWYGEDILGVPIGNSDLGDRYKVEALDIKFGSSTKVMSESCTIRNKFAYMKLIGRSVPTVQHMASTSRFYSVDLLFDSQQDSKELYQFQKFKETSDSIIRNPERIVRAQGWVLNSPVARLLDVPRDIYNAQNEKRGNGVFVPVNILMETGENPGTKTGKIDLAENNLDFLKDQEVILSDGGTDYKRLKDYFLNLMARDALFRSNWNNNRSVTENKIASGDTEVFDQFDAFQTVWPTENNAVEFQSTNLFGILNIDSLRAAFLNATYDKDTKLELALQNSKLATGGVVVGPNNPPIIDRIDFSVGALASIFGVAFNDPEIARIYTAVRYDVENKLLIYSDYDTKDLTFRPGSQAQVDSVNVLAELEALRQKYIDKLTWQISLAYLGDRKSVFDATSEAGAVLQEIAKSPFAFHPDFLDALFDVVTKRNPPPPFINRAYEADGLHTAFFKLISRFAMDVPSNINSGSLPDKNRTPLENELLRRKRKTAYPDMTLPSYIDLYGDDRVEAGYENSSSDSSAVLPRWQLFAPTFRDLGIINTNVTVETVDSLVDAQGYTAADPNDLISPSCWFYNKKYKDRLVEGLTGDSEKLAQTSNRLSLNVPFNTEEIAKIREEIEKQNKTGTRSTTLPVIIKEAFDRFRYDPANADAYREDIRAMKMLGSDEKFRDTYTGPNAKMITVYEYSSTYTLTRRVTVPGLGGEIYKVLDEYKRLEPTDPLPHFESQNEGYRAPGNNVEFEWIRSLDQNFKKGLKSSIDQTTDYHESANKLFPAAKVYLIDRRGNDVVADDSFFTVNPIISIDITLDKDDADLAVIKVADPMYILQGDFFPISNVQNIVDKNGKDLGNTVLSTPKGNIQDGYLRRYKLAQGRAVMIKLGYDSMPHNLQTVFTGRIAEIVPGDVLTIVCQGWKAELVNRQVNFYNENPRNWGAKELAIQTMVAANPEGFGEHIAERDAQFVLHNIGRLPNKDMLQQVLKVQSTSTSVEGTRNIVEKIENAVLESFGLGSTDKHLIGLDTRLKNIWYPDTPRSDNLLGWRSALQVLPSYINDSWIIPLMPAWDAFKEAARHAGWGTIVQVVPFDGEATLFFGKPDQPYFYTRNDDYIKSGISKVFERMEKPLEEVMDDLLNGFKESVWYAPSTGKYNEFQKGVSKGDFRGKSVDLLIDPSPVITAGGLDPTYPGYNNLQSALYPGQDVSIVFKPCLKYVDLLLNGSSDVRVSMSLGAGLAGTAELSASDTLVSARTKPIADALQQSSLPLSKYDTLKEQFGSRTPGLLMRLYFGIPEKDLQISWPNIYTDIEVILGKAEPGSDQNIEKIANDNTELAYTESLRRLKDLINGLPGMIDRDLNKPYPIFAPTLRTIGDECNQIGDRANLSEVKRLVALIEQVKNPRSLDDARLLITYVEYLVKVISGIQLGTLNSMVSTSSKTANTPLSDLLKDKRNLLMFKSWVYFFALYIESTESKELTEKLKKLAVTPLPKNMKVFRVHHHVDNLHDIIANNIVASTKEMWNTVVVEHPAMSSASSIAKTLSKGDSPFREGNIYSGVKWNYWPKREVTGVIGLQFHPGLTLSNKKIKIFTELNCQSEELVAKVACGHLAEGIKRMYRGNLAIMGRHIKPHDHIHLFDDYTRMHGTIEAETVVHHWSCETGWVTNITPQAVCDANPGAAILQTAMMEVIFGRVFKAIDIASDLLMWSTIIATLGGSASLAVGKFSITEGVAAAVTNVLKQGPIKSTITRLEAGAGGLKSLWTELKAGGASPIEALRSIYGQLGGLGNQLLLNYAASTTAEQAAHLAFKFGVIPAFIEASKKAEQLPVILKPLRFNGQPFVAGLETSDPIYSVWANGIFYSWRDLQLGAQRVMEEITSANIQAPDIR